MFEMLDILVKIVRVLIGLVLIVLGFFGLSSYNQSKKDELIETKKVALFVIVVLLLAGVIVIFG